MLSEGTHTIQELSLLCCNVAINRQRRPGAHVNAASASKGTAVVLIQIRVPSAVIPALICKNKRKGEGENFTLKY